MTPTEYDEFLAASIPQGCFCNTGIFGAIGVFFRLQSHKGASVTSMQLINGQELWIASIPQGCFCNGDVTVRDISDMTASIPQGCFCNSGST